MVNHWFFLTAGLLASSSWVYSLPTVDGSRNEGSDLNGGFEGLTEGVEQMMDFFDDVDSLNRTVTDMSRKLSNLKSIAGNNYNITMSAHERLNNSADRLTTLEDGVRSLSADFDILNNSIGGIETRLGRLEEEHSQYILDRMIQNPRAKLYTGLNHSGSFEYYDFISSTFKGGCYNLTTSKGKVKSVDTAGKCVRIFRNHNCHSWSQALYRGSSTSIDSILEGGGSIGPCAPNEFEYARLIDFENPVSKIVMKSDKQVRAYANVPDLIGDEWTLTTTTTTMSVSDSSTPITAYEVGHYGSRLEGIYGLIYASHDVTTEDAEAKRIAAARESFYAELSRNMDTDSYEPGFALPLELGGRADKSYNVFPQNKAKVDEYRALFVPQIKKHMKEYPNEAIIFSLRLIYSNEYNKTPAGIWYRLFKRGVRELTYGYITN